MSENNSSKLPIDQVYTVLKKTHPTYQATHSSLNEKNSKELLALIDGELASSKGLVQQLDSDVRKGLINPNFKDKADELVKKINNNLTVASSAIKQQLDEFIEFSELLFLILTKVDIWTKALHKTNLQNFAFLTKLKFNLFLDNLNHCLIDSKEKSSDLVRIAEILINHYFPAVANASYDLFAQGILLCYNTDINTLKETIENTDIPTLKIRLVLYQKRISAQKETFISAETSENDDEDYYSCYEFNGVENSDGSDSSDNDSCYLSEDEDEFFDALEHLADESLPSKNQSHYSMLALIQRLINWFRKLIHSLGHLIHRTEKNSPSTTRSVVQKIEPLDLSDTTSVTPPIGLENPTHSPISPRINNWKKQQNNHLQQSKSITNIYNFYRQEKCAKTAHNKPTTCLFKVFSMIF